MRNERERFFPFFFFFLNGDEDEKGRRKESLSKLHLFSYCGSEDFIEGSKGWLRADRDIERFRYRDFYKKIGFNIFGKFKIRDV